MTVVVNGTRENNVAAPKNKSSKYAGIKDAKANAGGMYFLANKGGQPANYAVKVLRCVDMVSRKKDDLFIVECEITKSDCPERPVGMKPSWVVNLKQDAALGNIKGFIAAANDIDPSDSAAVDEAVDEEAVEMAVGTDQPLAGTELNLTCLMIKTREGGDFTLHKWYPAGQGSSNE
jgi:hypothetical protein